jgi:hypothetical protein
VSNADVTALPSASDRRLEASLTDLFAVDLPAGVRARIDDRIDRRLRAWSPGAGRRSRLRPGRRAGVIGLLAAALVIGGANGSLRALYFFVAGPFDLPWHRGTELNLSQTVDGYRVTLDRAYADAARLALAISIVDEERRAGTTQVAAFSTVVTDEAGEYGGLGATSNPDGAFAAVNVAWKTPAALPLPAGPRRFHVELPFIMVRDDSTPPPNADEIGWDPWHRHPGPWVFDFELVVDGGTTVTPHAATEADGVRVELSRVIAASNIVRVEVMLDGDSGAEGWGPTGELRHGGRVLPFVVAGLEPDGTIVLLTGSGVANASGTWTFELDRVHTDVDPSREPGGPWVIEFTVP